MAIRFDPITGEMIDDSMEGLTPVANPEEQPSVQPDLKAKMYQNLMQKYGLNEFSPEKRQELEQNSQIGFGDRAIAAMGALGAGISGKDAGAAGANLINMAKAEKAKELENFDKRRAQAVGDVGLQQDLSKFEREESNIAEMKDPSSERSKAAQQVLIEDYGMDPSVASKLSAEQIKDRIPSLKDKLDRQYKDRELTQKREENSLNRAIKAESIAASRAQREQKAAEGSATQNAARGFGKRIEQAEQAFAEVRKDILDSKGRLKESGYKREDIDSGVGSIFPNLVRNDKAVQQEQAERNFINAVLRRESGAAISPAEFESAEQQYFPRVGDGPDTLKQKEANRKQILENMRKEAGKTWDETVPKEESSSDDQASIARQKRIAELRAKAGK